MADFFKRPANARITRQSPSGDRSKAVMVMVIVMLRLGENHRLAICQGKLTFFRKLKTTPFHIRFVRIADLCNSNSI